MAIETTVQKSLEHVRAALVELFYRYDFRGLRLVEQPTEAELLVDYEVWATTAGVSERVGTFWLREIAVDQTAIAFEQYGDRKEFELVLAEFLKLLVPLAPDPKVEPPSAPEAPSPPAIRVPKLPAGSVMRRWRETWRKLEPYARAKSKRELIKMLPSNLACTTQTLEKILRAGEAGLLDET